MKVIKYYRCRDCGTTFRSEATAPIMCPECESERTEKQSDMLP